MIRIDDERVEKGSSSSILFLLEKTMLRSDAWNKKMGAHASTLEMELMHEAEKQGTMHHFSSERSPAEPKAGRAAASVCVRFPGNPMNSVLIRKPRAGNSEKPGPAGFVGLRTIPRKPNEIGFDTQTPGR